MRPIRRNLHCLHPRGLCWTLQVTDHSRTHGSSSWKCPIHFVSIINSVICEVTRHAWFAMFFVVDRLAGETSWIEMCQNITTHLFKIIIVLVGFQFCVIRYRNIKGCSQLIGGTPLWLGTRLLRSDIKSKRSMNAFPKKKTTRQRKNEYAIRHDHVIVTIDIQFIAGARSRLYTPFLIWKSQFLRPTTVFLCDHKCL